MQKVYAEIYSIDYEKLLSRIQEKRELKKIIKVFVTKPFGLKTIMRSIGLINPIIKKEAKKYGLAFSVLRIVDNNQVYKNEGEGGNSILNIFASITDIDYQKMAEAISASTSKKKTKDSNDTVSEVIRIVKPFINDTMSTIPTSAISELFDVLIRNKITKLAGDYGVSLLDISVNSSEA